MLPSTAYQIDHIIEFSHWFMAALFVGWSAFISSTFWSGFAGAGSRAQIITA